MSDEELKDLYKKIEDKRVKTNAFLSSNEALMPQKEAEVEKALDLFDALLSCRDRIDAERLRRRG